MRNNPDNNGGLLLLVAAVVGIGGAIYLSTKGQQPEETFPDDFPGPVPDFGDSKARNLQARYGVGGRHG